MSESRRSIGLIGAVAIVVGYVVGASIFILPGELAADTGAPVFLSFLLASIPAIFACVVTSQVVGSVPEIGANYKIVTKTISPFWGFMMIWGVLATIVVGMPLLAFGFAEYLQYFFPDINLRLTAFVVVALFTLINYCGSTVAVRSQELLVLLFLIGLALYVGFGIPNVDPERFVPIFPNGFGSIAMAAIPAFFSFTGFVVIAELGGEIENPESIIPKALGIGFLIVLVTYLLVPIVLTGTISISEIVGASAPIAVSAKSFMAAPLANFVAIGALFAAATSINGVLLAQTRDIVAAGENHLLPPFFAKLMKNGTPGRAILLVGALGSIGLAVGSSIKDYAIVTVIGFMLYQILIGLAVIRLPEKAPEVWNKSKLKLPNKVRVLFSWALVFSSAIFLLIGLTQSIESIILYAVSLVIGIFYFKKNKDQMKF